MTRILVACLVVTLISTPLVAQTRTLSDSAARTLAAQSANGRTGAIQEPGWFWGGLALIGGGTLMSVLGNTSARKEECSFAGDPFFGPFAFSCVNQPNYGLVWSGVGVATVGSAFMWMGMRKHVTFGPDRVTVKVRF